MFVDSTHEAVFTKLMPTMTPERKELFLNGPVYEGTIADRQESCEQVRASRENNDPLRNIPMVVLTASAHELGNVWNELQADLAAQSNDSKHILVDDCGHYIQEDKPEVVKNAILEVADKIRQLRGSR